MTTTAAPAASPRFDSGSFRDRTNRVVIGGEEVFRALTASGLAEWQAVSAKPFFQCETASGRVVQTELLAPNEAPAELSGEWVAWLRHQRIPVISYPYEWPFSMLRDAALLTLDLMGAALSERVILKDATPYNVQYLGAQPVFIDVASFVLHDGGPWEGYRQFCQMFLFPLMLQAWRGVDFQPWLRGRLNGLTPLECRRLLGWRDMLRPGAFSHVYLHSLLSERVGDETGGVKDSLQTSGFDSSLVAANVRGLQRVVERLTWRPGTSRWSDYDRTAPPVGTDGTAKETFVRSVLETRRPRQVWDLGCNLGRYARLCAETADEVLALDVDHLTVDRLYHDLRTEGRKNILPLVYNFADPSPGLGWRGVERRPLADRSKPDLVLCLALLHHLVLHENLLLGDVIEGLADLGGALIIEFVDKSDPQARSLIANRRDQYHDYSPAAFESLLASHYTVRRREVLPSGTRTLYFAEPREHRTESGQPCR